MYNSHTKKGAEVQFLLTYRSNYHVSSFSSNKAFNVIANRTVIATNMEALHTVFAVMVTLSCLTL